MTFRVSYCRKIGAFRLSPEPRVSEMADQVRWFDALGACANCRKPAHGKLMGLRNESYGAYCTKCAGARLKKAERERADAEVRHQTRDNVSMLG